MAFSEESGPVGSSRRSSRGGLQAGPKEAFALLRNLSAELVFEGISTGSFPAHVALCIVFVVGTAAWVDRPCRGLDGTSFGVDSGSPGRSVRLESGWFSFTSCGIEGLSRVSCRPSRVVATTKTITIVGEGSKDWFTSGGRPPRSCGARRASSGQAASVAWDPDCADARLWIASGAAEEAFRTRIHGDSMGDAPLRAARLPVKPWNPRGVPARGPSTHRRMLSRPAVPLVECRNPQGGACELPWPSLC